jgi:hypothetical protein
MEWFIIIKRGIHSMEWSIIVMRENSLHGMVYYR